MTISLARAEQCIGRRVRGPQNFVGTIVGVATHGVQVRNAQTNGIDFMIADDLSWVSVLSPDLAEAIQGNFDLDEVQVGYAADIWGNETDASDGSMTYLPGVGIVFSGAISNDDGQPHPLYAVAHTMRKVHLLRLNANPDIAHEIEELLGWAQP